MRLDVYLVQNRLAGSRARAKALIEAGKVLVDGAAVTRPAAEADGRQVVLTEEDIPFVGRGGVKLEGAIADFGLAPLLPGIIAADIGASTGGFTDCLLRHGARRVFAIENGSGQLHARLRNDPRVLSLECLDARDITEDTLPVRADLATLDLSFISQTKVYPALPHILRPGGLLLSLAKPQFEVGRERVGGGGVVRDRAAHLKMLTRLWEELRAAHFAPIGAAPCRLPGEGGNREYFLLARALSTLGGAPSRDPALEPPPRDALRRVVEEDAVLRLPLPED